MFTEKQRDDWQHTASIIAYIIEVNRGKSGSPVRPDQLNPMEAGNAFKGNKGVPLNSPGGFAALSQLAKHG